MLQQVAQTGEKRKQAATKDGSRKNHCTVIGELEVVKLVLFLERGGSCLEATRLSPYISPNYNQ